MVERFGAVPADRQYINAYTVGIKNIAVDWTFFVEMRDEGWYIYNTNSTWGESKWVYLIFLKRSRIL